MLTPLLRMLTEDAVSVTGWQETARRGENSFRGGLFNQLLALPSHPANVRLEPGAGQEHAR